MPYKCQNLLSSPKTKLFITWRDFITGQDVKNRFKSNRIIHMIPATHLFMQKNYQTSRENYTSSFRWQVITKYVAQRFNPAMRIAMGKTAGIEILNTSAVANNRKADQPQPGHVASKLKTAIVRLFAPKGFGGFANFNIAVKEHFTGKIVNSEKLEKLISIGILREITCSQLKTSIEIGRTSFMVAFSYPVYSAAFLPLQL